MSTPDPSWHSTGGFHLDHGGQRSYSETVFMLRDSRSFRLYGRFKGPAVWFEQADAERFCSSLTRSQPSNRGFIRVIRVELKEISECSS